MNKKPKIYYKLLNPPKDYSAKYLAIARSYVHKALRNPNTPIFIKRPSAIEQDIVFAKVQDFIESQMLYGIGIVKSMGYIIYLD